MCTIYIIWSYFSLVLCKDYFPNYCCWWLLLFFSTLCLGFSLSNKLLHMLLYTKPNTSWLVIYSLPVPSGANCCWIYICLLPQHVHFDLVKIYNTNQGMAFKYHLDITAVPMMLRHLWETKSNFGSICSNICRNQYVGGTTIKAADL